MQFADKQDFKGQSLYYNHRISFDIKGPISPSSERNSWLMIIVDTFTHYVAIKPVPHYNAYYAYTTLFEHCITKFELTEILVTENGTEFSNNEIITLCHLYNIKHKPRRSHADKQDFKGQSLYYNHRVSFDIKGSISPYSEGNSWLMIIVDAFTHYVAIKPVPHYNAYYAYTTLFEHCITKFELTEILVTENGTEFSNNEIITLCHLYNIKHKPRTSHAPWTNGLVEGTNRSLREYLRCIINGNDTRFTEWSADVRIFPLSYNSQITTKLGISPNEMVFIQKPSKPIMFTANAHKNEQGYCQPNKDLKCYNLSSHTHDEDHIHHPQTLNLASSAHTKWILHRNKKHNEYYQKLTKKLLQRQNINNQINSRFTPATDLKIGTFAFIPNFTTQKGVSKNYNHSEKDQFKQLINPLMLTYKLTDPNKKEIVQHRNNLLPYYPKEYALRELIQLYSFTELKNVQSNPEIDQNQNLIIKIKKQTN